MYVVNDYENVEIANLVTAYVAYGCMHNCPFVLEAFFLIVGAILTILF